MKKKIKIKKSIKNSNKNKTDSEFMYYPTLDDDDFYRKIYIKKEFNKNKIEKKGKTIEEVCNPKEFVLSPQQNFIKNYISINTPYNGVLVFWSVGAGKTCAAISIAEQFKEYVKKNGKRILIILKKNIQKSFMKQIYNLNKELEKARKDDIVQCTGDTYSLSDDDKYLTKDQKRRKIRSLIKKNYQFVGYEQFANEVLRKTDWDGAKKNLSPKIIKKIEKEYSNRVIIIDEVHHINIKNVTDINIKKVPPILEIIIKYAKNVRLILMSATPMFDKPEEIIYLLNLLLINDKRDPIKISDVFESNGKIKEGGDKLLRDMAKGYVSYVRGDDPIVFPIKLYSAEGLVPEIKYNIKGRELEQDEEIKYLKLIRCHMSDFQYNIYQKVLKKIDKDFEEDIDLSENIISNENKINTTTVSKKNIGLLNLIYISNIIYPTKNGNGVFAKYGITSSDNGEGALYKITQVIDKKKRTSYKYHNHAIFNKDTPNEEPFLGLNHLAKYSEKFYKVLKNAIAAKGIIFIYTRYLPGGIIPFALALEQNGVQRYESDGDKQLLDYKANTKGGGGKTNPLCFFCGKFASDILHKPQNPNYHKWYAAKYMALTGDKSITKIDIEKAQDIINNKDNLMGQNVKIILGNEAISEGIDFHRIRQVHILEPWYNVSTLEQIIGRAVRNCSHVSLPLEDRNVEIFLYASVPPKKAPQLDRETETIDENRYRISEIKDIKIKKVERILKESAVDCLLNKNANIQIDKKIITLNLASGLTIKHKLGDQPYTRECDYSNNCNFKCNWDLNNNNESTSKRYKINEDTYNLSFAESDIKLAKKYIKLLFKKYVAYDLEYIASSVKEKIPSIEDKFVYKALDEIIKNKDEVVYDKFNREGHIIYRGKYYIFQPKELNDTAIPIYYRNIPIPDKTKKIPLVNFISEMDDNKKIEKNNDANIDVYNLLEKEIKNYYTKFDELIKLNNISTKDSDMAFVGMIIDRFSNEKIINIMKNLIIKHNSNSTKNDSENKVAQYFINNFFIDNPTSNKKSILSNKISGFYFQNKYYCISGGKWSLCNDTTRKKIELFRKIMEKKERPNADIVGSVSRDKKGNTIFQIIDKKKYKKTLTTAKKPSIRAEITGRVCKTHSLDNLSTFVTEIGLILPNKTKRKIVQLCIDLEFFLRIKNISDPKFKWFVNYIFE